MRIAPVNSETLAKRRAIVASFAAGVGVMFAMGLFVPISNSLSLGAAEAHALEQRAPAIQPLDVAAIEATLAEAERSMAVSRALTDDDISRLARLSH
ncbi:MAG: hypothetical protein NW206_10305 [Hyphomonadaceae bacterium]|nr:hypothetical protein [Hyphomonadaceae bacterium]